LIGYEETLQRSVVAGVAFLQRISAENRELPANDAGQIISPRYVHPGSKYAIAWREWLDSHPRVEWPAWLILDAGALA
jgi:hypothetical protein